MVWKFFAMAVLVTFTLIVVLWFLTILHRLNRQITFNSWNSQKKSSFNVCSLSFLLPSITRKCSFKNLWRDRRWLSQLQLYTAPESTPGISILSTFRFTISLKNPQKWNFIALNSPFPFQWPSADGLEDFKRNLYFRDRLGLQRLPKIAKRKRGWKFLWNVEKKSAKTSLPREPTSKVIDSRCKSKENIVGNNDTTRTFNKTFSSFNRSRLASNNTCYQFPIST